MLKLTKTGIGLLTRQYRSVLHKCWMINVGVWAMNIAQNVTNALGNMANNFIGAIKLPAEPFTSPSEGTLNAFNVSDDFAANHVSISRLLKYGLLSTTILGAATMPSEALAITPDEVMAEMNKSSAKTLVTWTSYATSGTESYNKTTHTGVQKINVNGTDYYFSYTFDAAHAGTQGSQNTPASNAYYDGFSSADGGAIYNSASGVILENDYFVGNSATVGGAIYNSASGTIESLTGDFSGNSAGQYGGAINNYGTIETLTGDFSGNYAGRNSGAIGNGGTIETLTGDFSGNSAGQHGGAIYNSTNGTIETLTGDFSGNSSKDNGGAIYNNSSGTIETLTGDFSGNSSTRNSGAISNSGTIETLTGDFSGNSATLSGGAIGNGGAIETLTGDFSGNSAGQYGGAIHNQGGIIGLLAKDKNISFYNNTDQTGYNDIYQKNSGDGKYISLAAASGRQISFGGTIDGDSDYTDHNILNINQGNNYGGDYIFNNQVLNHTINFGAIGAPERKATITLGKIKQTNSTTTYGAIKNSTVTNNADIRLSMQNDYVGAEQVNNITNLTLNHDLRFAIDAKLGLDTSGDTPVEANTADILGASVITDNGNHVVIDSINVVGKYGDSGKTATINIAPANSSVYKLAESGADVINMIEGNNYFTQAEYDAATGNLTLSDKLINQSTLDTALNNYYTKFGFAGKIRKIKKLSYHYEEAQNKTRHYEEAQRADVVISIPRIATSGRNNTAISLTTADARRRMRFLRRGITAPRNDGMFFTADAQRRMRLPRPDGLAMTSIFFRLAMTHSFFAAANNNATITTIAA